MQDLYNEIIKLYETLKRNNNDMIQSGNKENLNKSVILKELVNLHGMAEIVSTSYMEWSCSEETSYKDVETWLRNGEICASVAPMRKH